MEPLLVPTTLTYHPDVPNHDDMLAKSNYEIKNVGLCQFLLDMDNEENRILQQEDLEVRNITKVCQFSSCRKVTTVVCSIGGAILGGVLLGGGTVLASYLGESAVDSTTTAIFSAFGGFCGGAGGLTWPSVYFIFSNTEVMRKKRIVRLEAKVNLIDQELRKSGMSPLVIEQLNTSRTWFLDKATRWKNHKPEGCQDPGPIYSA